jgi:hypothetical protein
LSENLDECKPLFNGLAIFFRSLIIYFFLVRAAREIHEQLLTRIMKFPMGQGLTLVHFSAQVEPFLPTPSTP